MIFVYLLQSRIFVSKKTDTLRSTNEALIFSLFHSSPPFELFSGKNVQKPGFISRRKPAAADCFLAAACMPALPNLLAYLLASLDLDGKKHPDEKIESK